MDEKIEVNKQKRYWYKFITEECVLCGAGKTYKIRQYTEKPNNQADRYEFIQYVCGDHYVFEQF